MPFTADFREDRREFERRYISRCLEHTQGNVTKAAEILGMHRQSLQHKLRQLGLGRRYVSVGSDGQDVGRVKRNASRTARLPDPSYEWISSSS